MGAGPTWQAGGGGGSARGAANSAKTAAAMTPLAPPPQDGNGGAEGCADPERVGSPGTKDERRFVPSVVGGHPEDTELGSPSPFPPSAMKLSAPMSAIADFKTEYLIRVFMSHLCSSWFRLTASVRQPLHTPHVPESPICDRKAPDLLKSERLYTHRMSTRCFRYLSVGTPDVLSLGRGCGTRGCYQTI